MNSRGQPRTTAEWMTVLKERDELRKDVKDILLDALDGLSLPCTRADYNVAKLDEVVSAIAAKALKDFKAKHPTI